MRRKKVKRAARLFTVGVVGKNICCCEDEEDPQHVLGDCLTLGSMTIKYLGLKFTEDTKVVQ